MSPQEHYDWATELLDEAHRKLHPPAPGLTLDGWDLAKAESDRLVRRAHVHALLATVGGAR